MGGPAAGVPRRGAAVGLADVVVPHAPPARRILELYDRPGRHSAGLAVVAAATVVLIAGLVATSLAVARRRS